MLLSRFMQHRSLFLQLVRRALATRYRTSLFGNLWAFLTPLLMLLIYTFVFCEIFGMRWSAEPTANRTEFALNLFAGMVVFNFFAECLGSAPSVIVGHVNYVKKVVFPLELLPLANTLASLVHALGAVLILLLCRALVMGGVPLATPLVLLALLPLLFQVMGWVWFLAALGVYVRDINQVLGLALSGLMFLSPVFYPATRIPEKWRGLFALNPLTQPIEQVRALLVEGRIPADFWAGLLPSLFVGLVFAMAGYLWFQKTRSGFADVL